MELQRISSSSEANTQRQRMITHILLNLISPRTRKPHSNPFAFSVFEKSQNDKQEHSFNENLYIKQPIQKNFRSSRGHQMVAMVQQSLIPLDMSKINSINELLVDLQKLFENSFEEHYYSLQRMSYHITRAGSMCNIENYLKNADDFFQKKETFHVVEDENLPITFSDFQDKNIENEDVNIENEDVTILDYT